MEINKLEKNNNLELDNQIKNNKIDKIFLKDIEKKDCVFPDIDYHIYTKLN